MQSARRLKARIGLWVHRSGGRQVLTQRLLPLVGGLGGVVLDVGSGRDWLQGAWGSEVKRFRLDISLVNGPDVQCDVRALPIRPGGVDGVVMSEVLEHIDDPVRAVAEARRALRGGGTLIASTPFLYPIHGAPYDYFRYTNRALSDLLSQFDEVCVSSYGTRLGAAWRLVFMRLPILAPLNPILRRLSRGVDPMGPEGYLVTARRPSEARPRSATTSS